VQMRCERPLLGDPAFPRLGDALDAGVMLTKFREDLGPAGNAACEILACRLSRILQYTLRISECGCQKRKVDR